MDSMKAANPTRQGTQPASKTRRVAEGPFDVSPLLDQRLAEGTFEHQQGVQAMRALSHVSDPFGPAIARTGDQFVKVCHRQIVQLVDVILSVRQEIPRAGELGNQRLRNWRFILVHRAHGPDLWKRTIAPNGV